MRFVIHWSGVSATLVAFVVYLIFRWNEDLSLVQLDGSGDEHLRTGISRDLSLWVLQNVNGFSTVFRCCNWSSLGANSWNSARGTGHNCESLLILWMEEIPNNHRLDGEKTPINNGIFSSSLVVSRIPAINFPSARLESGKCPYGFTLYLGPSVFKGLMMAGEKCEYLNIV